MRSHLAISSHLDPLISDKENHRYLLRQRQYPTRKTDLYRSVRAVKFTNQVWAVVLIIALALLALHTRPDLSPNTDTVSDFAAGHLVADIYSATNNLMANADG
jgi:hypothetical protein